MLARKILLLAAPFIHHGSGFSVGLYSWDHSVWRDPRSRLLSFLESSSGSHFNKSAIYVNVADHVFPREIPDLDRLLDFMRRLRDAGNTQTIYVTYGDKNGADSRAHAGPAIFIDAYFDWLTSLPSETLHNILPLGISFDCERFPPAIVKDTLLYAQAVKLRYLESHLVSRPESLSIQWVVEGNLSPMATDAVMRFADSALMMVYRNYLLFSPSDAEGRSGLSSRLRDYFLTHQCAGCMLDEYAEANYRAKISIMVEASCVVDDTCSIVSFCAKDRPSDFVSSGSLSATNPVEYILGTLEGLDRMINSEFNFTPNQRRRLFAERDSLYVIHNFEWFSCYFRDNELAFNRDLCANYQRKAEHCRSGPDGGAIFETSTSVSTVDDISPSSSA